MLLFILAVPDQGGADVPYSLELLLALHRHLHWDLVVHWTDCTGVQPGNRLRVLATYLHHRSRGWSQRVRMTKNLKHIFQSYSICWLHKRRSFAMTRLTPWIWPKRLSWASCTFNTIFFRKKHGLNCDKSQKKIFGRPTWGSNPRPWD